MFYNSNLFLVAFMCMPVPMRKEKKTKQGRGRKIAKKRAQNWEKIEIKYVGKKKKNEFALHVTKKKVLRDLRKVRKVRKGRG